MYILCERIASTAAVQTAAALEMPPRATQAELVADTQNIRYTMDNQTAPAAGGPGMILKTTDEPKLFLIEDLRRIKFIADSGGAGGLNIHYLAGRDI